MTKQEYYEMIHAKISRELGVSLKCVETIRSLVLGPQKMSRADILLWIRQKNKKSGTQVVFKKERMHLCSDCTHLTTVKHTIAVTGSSPSQKYQEVETFIHQAHDSAWKDLTYPYSYSG